MANAAQARPGPDALSMRAFEWAMLLVLSVLWGGSFFFVGVAVRDLPTLTIVVLRVGLAALVLWGIVAVLGRALPRDPRAWLAFLGMGILKKNAMTPLFTVAVAGVLLADEGITRRKLAGGSGGFAGVIVLFRPGSCPASAPTSWRSSPVSAARSPTHSPGCSAGGSSASASTRSSRPQGR
ncbi:hypothetical protein SAMN05444340_103349 [Citreimonas salinaria]|uniref:EamA domain-containing protein n=2 Tax=Citreimonas salinaria TaxID=321339 RepID=A0A1H3HBU6_9RHOB|nr:hypothetical protein SAMN05444340_103349 [Citreimonas salinaria]